MVDVKIQIPNVEHVDTIHIQRFANALESSDVNSRDYTPKLCIPIEQFQIVSRGFMKDGRTWAVYVEDRPIEKNDPRWKWVTVAWHVLIGDEQVGLLTTNGTSRIPDGRTVEFEPKATLYNKAAAFEFINVLGKEYNGQVAR